jgi:hypothetical protein
MEETETQRAVEEIAMHLETAPLDEFLLMPGLGGLSVKKYYPNQHTPTTKYFPFWTPDAEAIDLANGDASAQLPDKSEHQAILDEWRANILYVPPEGMEVTVLNSGGVRLPSENSAVYALSEIIFQELRTRKKSVIPGLGTFLVLERPRRNLVQFQVDDGLKRRVQEARSRSDSRQ